jgi:hypothetical protein
MNVPLITGKEGGMRAGALAAAKQIEQRYLENNAFDDGYPYEEDYEPIARIIEAATALGAGQSIDVLITKHQTYTVTHDGWCLNIKATRYPLTVHHNPDGSVTVGNVGPVEDDDV